MRKAGHPFAIIHYSNLEFLYGHLPDFAALKIEYRFVNCGKSPAVLTSVLHGMVIGDEIANRKIISAWENVMSSREYYEWDRKMEIIASGEPSGIIACEISKILADGDIAAAKNEKTVFFLRPRLFQ